MVDKLHERYVIKEMKMAVLHCTINSKIVAVERVTRKSKCREMATKGKMWRRVLTILRSS